MLSKFLGGRSRQKLTGSIPPAQRIYAIGDIHGRLDLLDALLAQIAQDESSRGPAETSIIFLGDLVDRGPASAQVIDRAIQVTRERPTTRCLLGNHEEVFLKSIRGDLKALAFFCRIGGRETILSYGLSEQTYQNCDYPELLDMLQAAIPPAHVAFLEQCEDLIVVGDYAFVHAGVHPGESLALQKPQQLRWIRDEFLNHRRPLEKIIVHGHTISESVEIGPHRIGLDTGAYVSGKLTAMGFEGQERWVLDTAEYAGA
ncbi:metallophosphoesterase [Sphingomonas sp. CJ20]